jgi:HD-GYP domain-containing protein (c-di-GMP phosphodiesterase class II)
MFFCKGCRYSVIHSIQTALICKVITDSLGSSRDEQLMVMAAAMTMNISMIDLQDKLYYQKETLNEDQKKQIKTHPERSVSRLEQCGVTDRVWLDTVAQHHEYLNGNGYPKGLREGEIGRDARILTIGDMYCAKISSRHYRGPILPTVALRDFFTRSDNSLDKTIAQILIRKLGMYPPGLFVQLQNGEIAVVTHVGKDVRFPMISSLTNAGGAPFMKPIPRDCTKEQYAIKKGLPIAEAAVEVNRCQLWGYM